MGDELKSTREVIDFENAKSRLKILIRFQEEFQDMFPELHADIEDNHDLCEKYAALGQALNNIIQSEAKVLTTF